MIFSHVWILYLPAVSFSWAPPTAASGRYQSSTHTKPKLDDVDFGESFRRSFLYWPLETSYPHHQMMCTWSRQFRFPLCPLHFSVGLWAGVLAVCEYSCQMWNGAQPWFLIYLWFLLGSDSPPGATSSASKTAAARDCFSVQDSEGFWAVVYV